MDKAAVFGISRSNLRLQVDLNFLAVNKLVPSLSFTNVILESILRL